MTPFETQLAAYEQYFQLAEPKIAPTVSAIITKYYRQPMAFAGRPGLGDSSTDLTDSGALDLSQLTGDSGLLSTPAISTSTPVGSGSVAPAAATTNILSSLINSAGNFLTNQSVAQQKTAQLQAAATVAGANQASTSSTLLMVGGVVAVIALVAMMSGGRK